MASTDEGPQWINVPAHSEALLATETQAVQYKVALTYAKNGAAGNTYNQTRTIRHSGKTPTTSGSFTSDGFRLPTNWYRGVLRCESVGSFDFYRQVYPSGTPPWYRYHGSNSRALQGYVTPSYWDQVGKTLNLPQDVVEKSKANCMQNVAAGDFDLSEFLVDMGATYELACRLVSLLCETLIDLRKGKVTRAVKRLARAGYRNVKTIEDQASGWLGLQYGVKPLVNDVVAAISLLKSQSEQPLIMHASGSRTERLADTYGWANPHLLRGVEVQSENKMSARTEVWFKVDDAALRGWASVNFTNPFYLFWVSRPFSFLVDWAFPVGEWLSSLTSNSGSVFVASITTQRLQIDSIAEGWNSVVGGSGPDDPENAQWPKSHLRCMVMHRRVNLTWPKPELYVNRSPFRNPTRLLNALALAVVLTDG